MSHMYIGHAHTHFIPLPLARAFSGNGNLLASYFRQRGRWPGAIDSLVCFRVSVNYWLRSHPPNVGSGHTGRARASGGVGTRLGGMLLPGLSLAVVCRPELEPGWGSGLMCAVPWRQEPECSQGGKVRHAEPGTTYYRRQEMMCQWQLRPVTEQLPKGRDQTEQ